MSTMTRPLGLLLASLTAVCVCLLPRVTDAAVACDPWPQGSTCAGWRLAYDGYGSARGIPDAAGWQFHLQPQAVDGPEETSAALAITEQQFWDLQVSAHMRTLDQLRRPQGNPWEVAWLVWHYTDDEHFYYITLKPNGWELGKADPAFSGAQRFLQTGSQPTFQVGRWHEVQVRQVGAHIQVFSGGELLTEFRDTENPYTHGSVGLYTEDSAVEFRQIEISAVQADGSTQQR